MVLVFSLFRWRTASPGHLKDQDSHRETVMADELQGVSSGPADPVRTKPRFRANHPKPTIEETIELLRTTIIPVIDLPADQPLPERITRINELIQKAGVEPYQLRLILRSGDAANQWRYGEMRIREVPLVVALRYLVDATKLGFHVRENGIVELTSWREEALPVLPDPPQESRLPLSVESDIFGNDPNAPEEIDPFADHSL